ncbi:MAG: hypothetical protein A2046_12825 [Bacteroidetes bacterium GWA2_30_7]|nr:MAG: hypothetical protein A2046_12825 [Bacteroidetes bacterium GWA2_30_7]
MAIIHDIQDYKPTFNDSLFFDNNVWVFLFCPIANYELKKQRLYSNFLKEVRQSKSAIFINSLVLSEFCNFWLKTEFNNWKKSNPSKMNYKKDFIPTVEFKKVVDDIRIALNSILKITEKGSDNFNAVKIDYILTEFGNCDFNDSYYLELARLNNWKIVTDDSDLFNNNKLNIEIITGNIK